MKKKNKIDNNNINHNNQVSQLYPNIDSAIGIVLLVKDGIPQTPQYLAVIYAIDNYELSLITNLLKKA
jgi:hypothetical protein